MAWLSTTENAAQTVSTMAMHPTELPSMTSMPKQMIRTLEPTIRRLDNVTDRICHLEQLMASFEKQLAILKMNSQRCQQQLDSTTAVLRASDTTTIKDRLAAIEQNVLNLQLQAQMMIDNQQELQRQGLQDRQQLRTMIQQLQQGHPATPISPDEFTTDLP